MNRLLGLLAGALVLSGCASLSVEQNLGEAARLSGVGAAPAMLDSAEARERARLDVDARLGKPLSADDAVAIALASSAAVQQRLFESAASSAEATQSARLPNPIFAFERLIRGAGGDESIWRDVLDSNADEVARAIRALLEMLGACADELEQGSSSLERSLATLHEANLARAQFESPSRGSRGA